MDFLIKDCVKKSDRSMTYEGRIVTLEQKQLVDRESADKRHDNIKDIVQRHKETLDARVNMAIAYNEKIDNLKKEMKDLKKDQEEFGARIRAEIGGITKTTSDSKAMVNSLDKKLSAFESESRASHEGKKNAIQELNDTFEGLKGIVERSNMERDVEIGLRLKTQDFKNNFAVLTDLLETKFKQVEDTQ